MTNRHIRGSRGGWRARVGAWFDASAPVAEGGSQSVDWVRIVPFLLMHLACLGVLWVGFDPRAMAVGLVLYAVRMFGITGFYHRYFSHRAFRASRPLQFCFAVLGASAAQRGPLWWAAHHRKHHRHADTERDVHSPSQHGFWWSHMGWITAAVNFPTDLTEVRDLARYPELRWLDRFDVVVPTLLAAGLFLAGGWPFLIWGFFVSTVVLFHATCLINSLAHTLGRRRYDTDDDSRNSLTLAVITFGEGWHNNHHRFPGSARQGFYWWEFDLTYYLLWVLARVRLIRDLRPVPRRVLEAGR